MKIAYVTINIDPEIMNGGVGGKIKKQTALWKLMGHAPRLFLLTPEILPFPDSDQFVFKRRCDLLTREISRAFKLIQLILAVKRYQPDIVYFRFGLFTFPLQYLFRLFPTIIEVNTNDLVEYRSRGLFFYWFNRLTRDWMFSKCAGWVSTSYELAELEQNRKHKKPVCVISNGIEFEKYEPLPATGNHAPTLTLVGSPGMDWHGVDKLFFLAQACPELNINIVGYQAKDFKFSIPANIHLHGYLPPDQVKQILAQTDVVFGTLGLHRKSMSEASPLKVREALGYGIPVILAYEDTDLRDVSSEQILRLPNTENNIAENVQTIRDFAFRSIGQRIDRARISSRIDQRLKESRRVEFFAEIVEIHRRTS